MNAFRRGLRELRRYPSAVVGLTIVGSLVILAVYAVVALPYSEAARLWRGGEGLWVEYPRNARPAWFNLLPGVNLPETLVMDSAAQKGDKAAQDLGNGLTETTMRFPFEYGFDSFPQDVGIFLDAVFDEIRPFVSLAWRTPDGREIPLGNVSMTGASHVIRLSQDTALRNRFAGRPPQEALFAAAGVPGGGPLKGSYELVVEGLLFEDAAELDARVIVYGQVYGLAGTDHRRRDLTVALLWGAPVALSIGLLAAFGANFLTMVIAGFGVWFGRWVDALIQRITEVNLILPVLPILIMVGTFYSRSIWLMFGVVIALSIFGAGIKTYRAIFLQVKESPYIEAARAYGASNLRIVFRYMIPRVLPVLVPHFVVQIPTFVFLEATLALLGLGDPTLPTWGKVLSDGYYGGALYNGHYYWVLEPSILLMLTGLGFAMLGFALDRVFNPRLRGL